MLSVLKRRLRKLSPMWDALVTALTPRLRDFLEEGGRKIVRPGTGESQQGNNVLDTHERDCTNEHM